MMSVSAYRFHVGQFECIAFQDVGMARPLNQILSDAPQEEAYELARQYKINPEAIDFSLNILLVKTGDHLVLVDTGLGQSSLSEKIKSQGVDPAAIDTIILTHGHRDHVGGIFDAAGQFIYPNAHYFMWKSEYEYWTAPEQVATADKNPVIAILQTLYNHPDKLTLIGSDGDEAEVVPGVCAIFAPGHTPSHIAVSFESGTDRLLHIVDAAHVSIQISRTDWSLPGDYDKTQSVATRSKLFERAAQDKSLIMAYHFTFPSVGHVTNDSIPWTPVSTSED